MSDNQLQKQTVRYCLVLLILVTLACRPVIAIGWEELFILFALLMLLFGPFLFRVFKRLGNATRKVRSKEKIKD